MMTVNVISFMIEKGYAISITIGCQTTINVSLKLNDLGKLAKVFKDRFW